MKKELTSPSKKEDILKAIVELFEEANVGYDNHPSDRYYLGRHAALYDLLQMVKIYEKEDE